MIGSNRRVNSTLFKKMLTISNTLVYCGSKLPHSGAQLVRNGARMGESKLTPKQQRFVDEYMVDHNATQAAIRAGYSSKTAKDIASQNLAKLNIQAAIQEASQKQQARTGITADWVLKETHRLASFDPRKLFDENGDLRPIHTLDDETAACIGGVEVDRFGSVKVKVWDKNSALEKLHKHLGLFERDNKQKFSLEDLFKSVHAVSPDLAEKIKEKLSNAAK